MIYALSSGGANGGVGKSALAVIRMSGEDSFSALQKMLKHQPLPKARHATLCNLYDPQMKEGGEDLLDRALVLVFPSPHSFTGENMVELHVHGGGAVVRAVLSALSSIEGGRYAVAGEFSRIAFANGKMDFTAAEGLADLINAETDAQRQLALRQVDGQAYRLLQDWCGRLAKILAYIEACLDFPDEELPQSLSAQIISEIEELKREMDYHASLSDSAERLRQGIRVAIVGSPNVGKSSLLNYFAGRDAAIVSHVAGTTRDVIEVFLELDGLPVILTDTAGLRESSDSVEGEGIRRARQVIAEADIRLWMYDLSDFSGVEEDIEKGDLVVFNKSDLVDDVGEGGDGYIISVASGAGLDNLRAGLLASLGDVSSIVGSAILVRLRHGVIVREVLGILDGLENLGFELLAEELRGCLELLGRVTGRVSSEDLLDIIFGDFCIGK